MKYKKALIVIPNDTMGGAERVTRTVACAALKSGSFSEVHFLVLSCGDTGTLAHFRKMPGAKTVYSNANYVVTGLSDLIRVCRRNKYDFTFCSFSDLNALLCLLRSLKILRTERLVTRESTMVFERDFGWKSPLIRLLYKFYGSQDLIVCQTRRMETSLIKHTSGRFRDITSVIPNPLDFELSRAPDETDDAELFCIPENRCRVVWCGRLSPVKSPLRAIEVLAELHSSGYSNTHLVMIGDGPMRTDVGVYAQTLGLADYVTLTGFHPQPIQLMRNSHVGLVTSDIEGFPNVITEMLYAGVKGIASTNCAGDLEKIPGLVLSDDKTPKSLSMAIIELLSRPGPCGELSPWLRSRKPTSFLKELLFR